MNRFEWTLLTVIVVLLAICITDTARAEPMGQQEFCQAIAADAARVVVLRTGGKITYEQTLASIPPGLPAYQDAMLRKMIDLAFQTAEDPMDFAITIGNLCQREAALPSKYDDAFIHRAGEHHLSQQTIDKAYKDGWKLYQAAHPRDLLPGREPKIGFATPKGMCEAMKSKQDNDCAVALTGGELGAYPLPGGVDILLDEVNDYDSTLGLSIMLHEFIHYFQYYNNGPLRECGLRIPREHEAYGLQAKWLSEHGGEEYVVYVMAAGAKQRCPKGQP